MATTETQIWILFFATAALTGMMTVGLGWLITKIAKAGKNWLILVDQDAGRWKLVRARARDGAITLGKEDNGRRYQLSDVTRYVNGFLGPLNIMTNSGFNLAAPSSKDLNEMAKKGEAGMSFKLLVQDPHMAYTVVRQSVARDFVTAPEKPVHWIVRVAPLLLIVTLVALGVVAWLGYQVVQSQGA